MKDMHGIEAQHFASSQYAVQCKIVHECCFLGAHGKGLQQQLQDKERRNNALLSMLKKGPSQAAPPSLSGPPTASSSHRPDQQPSAAGRWWPAERQASHALVLLQAALCSRLDDPGATKAVDVEAWKGSTRDLKLAMTWQRIAHLSV